VQRQAALSNRWQEHGKRVADVVLKATASGIGVEAAAAH
jgi:hypothetical protein